MGSRRGRSQLTEASQSCKLQPSQLLPTPQTSTTSTKEDYFLLSSEIDEVTPRKAIFTNRNLRKTSSKHINKHINNIANLTAKTKNTSKPRLLKSKSKISTSSWPFRSSKPLNNTPFLFSFDPMIKIESKDLLKLKRLLQRDFPYDRVIDSLSANAHNLLFKKDLWTFLSKVSTIYTGENVEGDRQKRNEVAFAAWTTILRVYGRSRVRGGEEQLERLAVASIVLQSKLLEESDVDLMKLEKKLKLGRLTKFPCEKEKIEACERRICCLLDWKLLVPSAQVILFSLLDVLALPMHLKQFVSKILDQLIEEFQLQEHLLSGQSLTAFVVAVIEIVLTDVFSVFQGDQIDVGKLLKENLVFESAELTLEQREKIEKAVETVMSLN